MAGPEPAADAAITALLRRTLNGAEALARELREALGENTYGSPCRRHGWEDCEDVTCQQIANAAAAAAAAERARLLETAVEHKITLFRPAADGPGGEDFAFDVVPLAELAKLLGETQP